MNRITSLLLMVCFSILSFAQNNLEKSLKKWQLARIDFGFAIDHDQFASMNYADLMTLAKDKNEMQRDLTGMKQEANGMTAGGAFYINAAFTSTNNLSEKYAIGQELRIGMGFHTDKEAMVSFKDKNTDTSIVFCNLHSERSVNAAYVLNKKLGEKWSVYAGISGQVSWTKGNEMIVMAGKYFPEGDHPSSQVMLPENKNIYQANTVVYNRIFIPYGITYAKSDKWTYGLDIRKGLGFQHVMGGPTNYIKRSGGFAISFKRTL